MKKLLIILFLLIVSKIALADVVINEIMYNPYDSVQCPDANCEWIELYNNGALLVELNGWTVDDNSFEDVVILPDEYIIVAKELIDLDGGNSFEAYWGNKDFIWGSNDGNYKAVDGYFTLKNSGGDTIILKDNNGEVIDSLIYSNEWGADGNGKTLEFYNGNWYESSIVRGTPGTENSYTPTEIGIVEYVVDGDTLELETGERVRLIGIDTPEVGEYYYEEAKDRLKEIVEGKSVILERDIEYRDIYDRLLRYVYVDNWFVNLVLVQEGYASVYPYEPNTKYKDEFADAESEAKERGLGIWNEALTGHDIQLETYLDDEINLGIEQTKLFKITNLNPEIGRAYNITVHFNITKDNVLVKEDFFVKDEVNSYSTTGTGSFLPEGVGQYTLCGRIINSSVEDNNPDNDKDCKGFAVVDTSQIPCNITLSIIVDKDVYIEGESIKFYNNLNNKEFPFVIEYWIEDFFGKVYKNQYNTTNTNQKSWKTNIEEEDRVLFVKAIVYPNCNDTDLSDNSASKMFIVKSNYSGEGEEEIENENSSLEIVKVDDNVKFGEVADIKVKLYKGDTGKYSISLWVEEDGKKISDITKIHMYDKYSYYNGQLPVNIDNNCDNNLEDGSYDVVLSGFGLEERGMIEIAGVKTSLCPKTSTGTSSTETSSENSKKKFDYEVTDYESYVKVKEEFIVKVKLENNDNEDYDIKVWSYVYRGSKSYTGDQEANIEEFVLGAGKSKVVELKNIVLDAESGEYKLKVKINKNNQKTDYEITKSIKVEAVNEEIEKNETIEEKKKMG